MMMMMMMMMMTMMTMMMMMYQEVGRTCFRLLQLRSVRGEQPVGPHIPLLCRLHGVHRAGFRLPRCRPCVLLHQNLSCKFSFIVLLFLFSGACFSFDFER